MNKALLGVLVGVVLLSGCRAGGASKLGAGEPVDACAGVTALNQLPEPDIANRPVILDYVAGALRVVDRIDTDRDVHTIAGTKIAVPGSVVSALKAEKGVYLRLQSDVTAATTATTLHEVVARFTTSPAFAGADSTVELWAGNECG